MTREYIIRLVAGTLVLAGTALGYFVAKEWLLLPAFVGLNLLQSSFTKFCPLEIILKKTGIKD
ncbi:MAG: hypothetical protein BGN96_11055 [Bacteroidales bacterium 45-6]|nr:MAG: hypothetical protein BGN96_11055 [Bacteroidales bacterium 45-6]